MFPNAAQRDKLLEMPHTKLIEEKRSNRSPIRTFQSFLHNVLLLNMNVLFLVQIFQWSENLQKFRL